MYKFLLNINMRIIFITIAQLVTSREALCDAWLGKLTCKKQWALHYMGHQRNLLGRDRQETVGSGAKFMASSSN